MTILWLFFVTHIQMMIQKCSKLPVGSVHTYFVLITPSHSPCLDTIIRLSGLFFTPKSYIRFSVRFVQPPRLNNCQNEWEIGLEFNIIFQIYVMKVHAVVTFCTILCKFSKLSNEIQEGMYLLSWAICINSI